MVRELKFCSFYARCDKNNHAIVILSAAPTVQQSTALLLKQSSVVTVVAWVSEIGPGVQTLFYINSNNPVNYAFESIYLSDFYLQLHAYTETID